MIPARIEKKIDRRSHPKGCHLWTGFRNAQGYGRAFWNGTVRNAHRIIYSITVSDPGDLFVLHRCDNPSCVNVDHLFLGTNADNVRDMWTKGRRKTYKRLTDQEISEIRKIYDSNKSELRRAKKGLLLELCSRYEVPKYTMYAIVLGRIYQHVRSD